MKQSKNSKMTISKNMGGNTVRIEIVIDSDRTAIITEMTVEDFCKLIFGRAELPVTTKIKGINKEQN